LKEEVKQGEEAIKLLQSENKNLLNQLETLKSDIFKKEVDIQEAKKSKFYFFYQYYLFCLDF